MQFIAVVILASINVCYSLRLPPLQMVRPGRIDSDGVGENEVAMLKSRVDRLSQYESEYLLNFWNDELKCFQIMATKAERVSVVSTCSIVDLILKNRSHWKRHVSWDGSGGTSISLEAIMSSLLSTTWSYDSLQAPTLVRTLSSLRAVDPGSNGKYQDAVQAVLEQRSRLSLHRKQTQSSYLRYINVMALLEMVKHNMIPPAIAGTNQVSLALERANLVAYDELSRQLAFHFSGDSSDFDVIVLAFSLLAYYETSESQYYWGDKKRENAGVQGSANMALVKTALEVIFANQFSDGTWRKGEPIHVQSSGTGGNNRDIGNSFVFFFDIVSGIIKALPQELLSPYMNNFERCVTWAENNLQKEMPEIDCDSSGLCQGPMIHGWKSNHVSEPATTAWTTSSVFNFLDELSGLLDLAQTSSVLTEFKGKRKEAVLQESGGRECWYRLMDADLGGKGARPTMKEVLFDKVLLPHLIAEVEEQTAMLPPSATEDMLALGQEMGAEADEEEGEMAMPSSLLRAVQEAMEEGGGSSGAALYSLILFGPPGTAKTTIATSLASVINYNFVTIDTATFLANGLENVASRMSYIFGRLKSMTDTVILFDEIEEFCLDRENPNLSMESRMLTTAMLTQLNALRRDQRNIFLIATNRLRSFDAAVIRPGRFDLLAFVGTPNYRAREARLVARLSSQSALLTRDKADAAVALWSRLVLRDWDETLRFFTFAENEALNAEVVALLKANALTEESLSSCIASIDATSTIQGPIRQEYIDSEGLSRY
jgi:hypothetical protein